MPFVVALLVIGILLIFMFVAAAREPGVGPGETAVAYAAALGRGDISTAVGLSDDSMLAGLDRGEVAGGAWARADGAPPGSVGASVLGVETVTETAGRAVVVTCSVEGGATVRSEVCLVRKNSRWRVTGFTPGVGLVDPPAE